MFVRSVREFDVVPDVGRRRPGGLLRAVYVLGSLAPCELGSLGPPTWCLGALLAELKYLYSYLSPSRPMKRLNWLRG